MCWIISDAICWEIQAAVLHLLTKSAFWSLQNKAYAAEVSTRRRVGLGRLKFPAEAYNHFLMECQSLKVWGI